MKNYKLIVCFLGVLTFYQAISLKAQNYLHTEDKNTIDKYGNEILLKSMGLGGWMLQEGYMLQTSEFANTQHEIRNAISDLIGPENTDTFYTAWLANHCRRADIDSLASWGFNSIRLPMHYNLFTPQHLPVGQYINTGFELVDSLLNWCEANQIYLILDLHGAPGGQGDDAAISDYDPTKPSLWEDDENKDRTVDLWKTLAARYANEEWIGGYDLINEPKWEPLLAQNNAPLWELYQQITDSIRSVDTNHLIIIEGNMWANNYTGFPGPWDNNMVISFHKYWNPNNIGAIQWVLNMRNQYNVPVWLGETGENSNTWFVEMMELMEQNNIGYAFWPEKKIGSVAGPVTINKTTGYQALLDYWTNPGSSKPDTISAKTALMELAENLKIENCTINPDVTDVFSRQVFNISTRPYSTNLIPGIIFASNYDIGREAYAYHDIDFQNIGNGSWNSGGGYRNDGVDIEECNDVITNGFDVGWTAEGEWLKYTIISDSTAAYKLTIRYAGLNPTVIHFESDSVDITGPIEIEPTSAWNVWDSLTVENIVLSEGTQSLVLNFDEGGCNLNWFEFSEPVNADSIDFLALSAETNITGDTIKLILNKPCSEEASLNLSEFSVLIDDVEQEPLGITISKSVLFLEVPSEINYKSNIILGYTGTSVHTVKGQLLEPFTIEVNNMLPPRHQIPGKIQAEDFTTQTGLQTETTTDTDGGLNIGYTDAGDYLDYLVDIQEAGQYQMDFRTSALNQAGAVQVQLIDQEDNVTQIGGISFPVTGGWQNWRTSGTIIELPKGMFTLRVRVTNAGFNLNWFEFIGILSSANIAEQKVFKLFPNPSKDKIYLEVNNLYDFLLSYQIVDLKGRVLVKNDLINEEGIFHCIDISMLDNGIYTLSVLGLFSKTFIVKR